MLFKKQVSRKPNLYPWTQKFKEAIHEGFWTDKEFDFVSDLQDFKVNMSPQQREVTVRSLSAIAQVEVAVKTFWGKLGDNLPHPSIQDLGFVMANSEVIHNDAYERLIDVLGLNSVFEDNLSEAVIGGRVDYLNKHLIKAYGDKKKQYIYSIILFTLFVENVSLFSQFYIATAFRKEFNYLKDTCQQITYTTQEEILHSEIGIRIINTLQHEYPDLFDEDLEKTIIAETKSALESEFQIIDWILGDYTSELVTPEICKEFIKDRMNTSMEKIGYSPNFEVDQDVLSKAEWFEEFVLGDVFSDFFYTKPTEYTEKAQVFDGDSLF